MEQKMKKDRIPIARIKLTIDVFREMDNTDWEMINKTIEKLKHKLKYTIRK